MWWQAALAFVFFALMFWDFSTRRTCPICKSHGAICDDDCPIRRYQ